MTPKKRTQNANAFWCIIGSDFHRSAIVTERAPTFYSDSPIISYPSTWPTLYTTR